jgi:hypothetical protein
VSEVATLEIEFEDGARFEVPAEVVAGYLAAQYASKVSERNRAAIERRRTSLFLLEGNALRVAVERGVEHGGVPWSALVGHAKQTRSPDPAPPDYTRVAIKRATPYDHGGTEWTA